MMTVVDERAIDQLTSVNHLNDQQAALVSLCRQDCRHVALLGLFVWLNQCRSSEPGLICHVRVMWHDKRLTLSGLLAQFHPGSIAESANACFCIARSIDSDRQKADDYKNNIHNICERSIENVYVDLADWTALTFALMWASAWTVGSQVFAAWPKGRRSVVDRISGGRCRVRTDKGCLKSSEDSRIKSGVIYVWLRAWTVHVHAFTYTGRTVLYFAWWTRWGGPTTAAVQ